jgi:hypothetical protein
MVVGARVGRWVGRIVRRASRALDLDRNEPAGVVGQIRQAGVLRIDLDLVHRQVTEALGERRAVRSSGALRCRRCKRSR